MKKNISKYLVMSFMGLFIISSITGCGGEKVGKKDVVEQVKNGTYEIALTDDANPIKEVDPSVTDASATDVNAYAGWVVETQNADEMTDEIKQLSNKITEITPSVYIGYRVEDKTIRYAFTGMNKNNERTLVYVLQDTEKNKITTEIGNYDDVGNIYTNGGN